MTIRSLLFGSAAALVAVSGARAADAIIAEPEPVEYVRVCDAYGAGFFYIPGTETCLQISGYVWYQIGAEGFDDDGDSTDFLTYGTYPDKEGWIKSSRARVNFDARSETEWGTLRGFIRFQGTGENVAGDFAVAADQAFLELGGLRMGYTESAWVETQNGGVAAYGSHSWGSLYYGDQQRQLIAYSFGGGNGFHATLSLESDDYEDAEDYIPDVVGVAGINQGWGGIWAKVGYDEDYNGLDDGGFGAQAGLQLNIPNMEGSSFRLIGFYASADVIYGVGHSYGIYLGGNGAAEWGVLASYYHQITPTLGASVGFEYLSDLYVPGTDDGSGLDAFIGELSVVWTPVENFEVRAEYYYDKVEDLEGTSSGFLRFTRYF